MGGRGVSVWGCGGRRRDAKEGKGGKGEGEEGEKALIFDLLRHWAGYRCILHVK